MAEQGRNVANIIWEVCREQGIHCTAFSAGWLFELEKGGQKRHVLGHQFGLNSAISAALCTDKAAASQVLLHNGIPAVPHWLFVAPDHAKYVEKEGSWGRLLQLLKEHGALVCKKNEGSGGIEVYKAADAFALEAATYQLLGKARAMAVCPYYDIQQEYRVVVMDGEAKLVFAKEIDSVTGDGLRTMRQLAEAFFPGPSPVGAAASELETPEAIPAKGEVKRLYWKHNLGLGATALVLEEGELRGGLAALALGAAQALGISFASVDVVDTCQGRMVLEVNSGVMLEYFSKMSKENYQIAKAIYSEAICRMF